MIPNHVIAWDFDGVLNRNFIDGRFIWQANFDADLGLPLASFVEFMFTGRFEKALVGNADIIDLVRNWLDQHNSNLRPHDILEYWFSKDANPDKRMMEILQKCREQGSYNVIATNNEIHRTDYIETQMGFGGHVEKVFSAGRLQTKKPDAEFFHSIECHLGVQPDTITLIDDKFENVEAARRLGWNAIHFVENGYAALEEKLLCG